MKMQLRDRLSAVVMFVLAVLAFVGSRNFSEMARTYPNYIIGLLLILSVMLFIKSLSKVNYQHVDEVVDNKTGEVEEIIEDNTSGMKVDPDGQKRIYITLGATVLYIILMTIIGFYVTSFLFMVGLFIVFQVKNKWAIVLIPLITTSLVYLVFKMMLVVPTPEGLLF